MTDLFADPIAGREPLGARTGLWVRRGVLALFVIFATLGLANRFGQEPVTSSASGPAASLTLLAPRHVRGGLFFESRVRVRAARSITRPRLVLGDGWVEGMQVNSIEPAPSSEASRDGRIVLSWNELEAGDRLEVWFQFEVDPTSVGERDYSLELDDGDTALARVSREITVLP
jgi:hypothetical protein